MTIRVCRALVAVLLVVSALPAAAQQASPAFLREYQAGIDAYRLGKYAEARMHLAKAAEAEPKLPGPHRWLAAVEQAEDKWAECVKHARRAIKLNPQSSEIVQTRELLEQCRSSLGRMAFVGDFEGGGALAVTCNVSGAIITVNGLRYGVTPLAPRALASGTIDVVVEKAGWRARKLEIDILPSVVTDLEVELEADPAAKVEAPVADVKPTLPTTGWIALAVDRPGAAVTINGMDVAADAKGRYERPPGTYEVVVTAPGRDCWRRRVRVARGQVTTARVTLPSPEARRGKRRIGAGFVAGAAVLAGAGVASGVLSMQANEEARDWWEIERTRPTPDVVPVEESARVEPLHTRQDIADAVDRSERWGLVSNLTYGAAAVSLGIGVYFLVKERPVERDGHPAPFAIAPVIDDGRVGVSMRAELAW